MAPLVNAPFSDRKGESFANCNREVELWRRVTNLGPAKRASALMLEMDVVARKVCVATWGDQISGQDGAIEIMKSSHDSFALDTAGSVYQEVARFSQFELANRTTDAYLARSDLTHREAESRMQLRRSLPEVVAPAPFLQNAATPHGGNSLFLARTQGNVGIAALPQQMRRLPRPRRCAVREDVLTASAVDANSNGCDNFAASVAYRGAKKRRGKAR